MVAFKKFKKCKKKIMIKFVQLCVKFFLFIFLGVSSVSHFYGHVYMGYGHLLRIDSPPPPLPTFFNCAYMAYIFWLCVCGLWLHVKSFFFLSFFGEGFLTHFWWCACAKVARKDVLTTIVRLSGL
jgi:hypothetical protein